MKKILLIIQREYLSRVRNKTFLLSTFLLPIMMILFIAGSVFFSQKGKPRLKLAVVTDNPIFLRAHQTDSSSILFEVNALADSLNYFSLGYEGVLYWPAAQLSSSYRLYSQHQIGWENSQYLKRLFQKMEEEKLLEQRGLQRSLLDSISSVSEKQLEFTNIVTPKEGPSREANAPLTYALGFGSGILIYISIFIFGAMVMRGVMEEKMSRIAEVIISSVRPFQLMIGKVVGIAAVGLTQFLLWLVLLVVIANAASLFLSPALLEQANTINLNNPGIGNSHPELMQWMNLKSSIQDVNWPLIAGCFLFYFLGGYLFYAALFAAVGSVVNEDPQEAQSLMLPITLPVLFSFIILSNGLQDTNSPLMFWGSLIPFTSPIIMMGRIPAGVPWTQIAASMLFLVAGFLFTIWLAGKIYRTGILLYGKKASWKEMLKWAFRKN
jgi:ABC-2 type transport system permease protein